MREKNLDRTRFAYDETARRMLVLLRMSGRSQTECGQILGCPRQSVSIEEQEPRYKELVDNYVSILASVVDLPEHYKKHFPAPDTEDDLRKIQKSLYV